MLSRWIISPFFILLSFSGLTQLNDSSQFYVEFNGGAVFSTIIPTSSQARGKWGARMGFNAGYQLTRHIFVEAGCAYSNKGNLYRFGSYDINGDAQYDVVSRFHFRFLEVPVSAGLRLGKKVQVFTTAGVKSALLLDVRSAVEGGENPEIYEANYTSQMNRMDVLAIVSTGIQTNLKWFYLKWKVGAELGLISAYRKGIQPIRFTHRLLSSTFGLGINF